MHLYWDVIHYLWDDVIVWDIFTFYQLQYVKYIDTVYSKRIVCTVVVAEKN